MNSGSSCFLKNTNTGGNREGVENDFKGIEKNNLPVRENMISRNISKSVSTKVLNKALSKDTRLYEFFHQKTDAVVQNLALNGSSLTALVKPDLLWESGNCRCLYLPKPSLDAHT